MRTGLLALSMLAVAAPAAAAAADEPRIRLVTQAAFRPVEVAKRRGFVIHAIPRNTDRGWQAGLLGEDYILTHTSLPDGKLKVLLRSGVYRTFSPPMGIDKVTYHKTELLGVAVRGKRLAVLTRDFIGGVVLMPRAPKRPGYGNPQYRLTLFDARDGEKLSALYLNWVTKPEVARLREIGPGPLKVETNRISVWGRTIRIDQHGRMVLEAESKKPRK